MTTSDGSFLRGSGSVSDQRDFGAFYRESREEMVRALVLALGLRDLGVEAADEAYARALERWDEVSGYENPEGWVYRVGLNWARSRLRRRRFSMEDLFSGGVHVDELPDPELLEAVEDLSFKYRSVVVARFFLDWSIEQTATALGIPEGTVKTRQSRALERLRRRLGGQHES
jgi:RNA polymerase sigma-70 factor (ECF subfamily)